MPNPQIQVPIQELIWEERERMVPLETIWGVARPLGGKGGWAVLSEDGTPVVVELGK